MKNTRIIRAFGAAALSTAILLSLAATSRASLTYNVTLNVASLVTDLNGPFSLDLQLIPGQDNVTNQVSITNFVLTGGSFTGSPTFTNGGESGSTSTSILLTMSDPADNEFAQAFTSGTTQISFKVIESNNQETGGTSPAPDQFNIAILDGNLNNIATTDLSGGNALVSDAMVGSQSLALVNHYSSTGSDGNGGVTAAVTVPEPGSAAMLLFGAVGLLARRKRSDTLQSA